MCSFSKSSEETQSVSPGTEAAVTNLTKKITDKFCIDLGASVCFDENKHVLTRLSVIGVLIQSLKRWAFPCKRSLTSMPQLSRGQFAENRSGALRTRRLATRATSTTYYRLAHKVMSAMRGYIF